MERVLSLDAVLAFVRNALAMPWPERDVVHPLLFSLQGEATGPNELQVAGLGTVRWDSEENWSALCLSVQAQSGVDDYDELHRAFEREYGEWWSLATCSREPNPAHEWLVSGLSLTLEMITFIGPHDERVVLDVVISRADDDDWDDEDEESD